MLDSAFSRSRVSREFQHKILGLFGGLFSGASSTVESVQVQIGNFWVFIDSHPGNISWGHQIFEAEPEFKTPTKAVAKKLEKSAGPEQKRWGRGVLLSAPAGQGLFRSNIGILDLEHQTLSTPGFPSCCGPGLTFLRVRHMKVETRD